MTCKRTDCIHYEACKTFNQYIPNETDNIDRFCDEFKDKSHFLKLPCKVGDTIYKLWYAPCHNGEIYPDSYGCDGCYDKCDLHKEIFEFEVPSLGFIVNELLKDDNSVYFFTYEEAKKALEKEKKI